MKPKLTTGDARRMAADDLYRMVEKVVDRLSHLSRQYYILVIVRNHYQGPAAGSKDSGQRIETTDVVLPDKMIHNRIVAPLFEPPAVRMLGSMLWRVDNRVGEMELMYAMPYDVPTVLGDSDNEGTVVGAVAERAKGMPLIWS